MRLHRRVGAVVVAMTAVTATVMFPQTAADAAVNTNTIVTSKTQAGQTIIQDLCNGTNAAVGGGFDLSGAAGPVRVLMSSPLFGNASIANFPDGPVATNSQTGWEAVTNIPGGPQLMKVGVVCHETNNGTLGSVQATVASGTVPAQQRTTVTAACPAPRQVDGGAFDTTVPQIETSAPLIGTSRITGIPDGTYGPPASWEVTAANPTGTDAKLSVAALCSLQNSLGDALTVVTSTTIQPNTVGGSLVACPAKTEAVGGGIDGPVGLRLLTDGPSPGGRLNGVNDGPAGSSDGWSASAFNPNADPAAVKVAVVCLPSMKYLIRLGGADRIDTAVNVSTFNFATGGTPAQSVVLARSDPNQFADNLVGAPLAVAKGGPMLLTPHDSLDPRTKAEIQRLIPAGKTVYFLGGTAALAQTIADQVTALGYVVVRYGGIDRFATAAIIADQGLGNPTTVMEATGLDFPDALGLGAAAATVKGAILLTKGAAQADATAAYLTAHPPTKRYAVGGPAAAADPGATALVGTDRFDTSAVVAGTFFPSPGFVGIATGLDYPDALAGAAFMGSRSAPMLLVRPDALPPSVGSYLTSKATGATSGFAFGGATALSDPVRVAVGQAIS